MEITATGSQRAQYLPNFISHLVCLYRGICLHQQFSYRDLELEIETKQQARDAAPTPCVTALCSAAAPVSLTEAQNLLAGQGGLTTHSETISTKKKKVKLNIRKCLKCKRASLGLG